MTKNVKGQRYSKNCFKIRGKQELFIKGEVLVNFGPLPKKYSFDDAEKTLSIPPSYPLSTGIASSTHLPSAYLPPSTKPTRFCSRTTTEGLGSPSYRLPKWFTFSYSVLPQTKEQT